MQPIDANANLAVELTANEWNVVIAGLGELPLKFSGPVDAKVKSQLQTAVSEIETMQPQTRRPNGGADERVSLSQ